MISHDQLEQVKERLIKIYDPVAIYIFGSYAWGKPNEESDLDLLIVVDDYKRDRYNDLVEGHRSLIGMNIAKDILLYNKQEFEACALDATSICFMIRKKGKMLYAKA